MGVAPGISAWFYSTPQEDFFTDVITWLAEIANDTNAPLVHSIHKRGERESREGEVRRRRYIKFI